MFGLDDALVATEKYRPKKELLIDKSEHPDIFECREAHE